MKPLSADQKNLMELLQKALQFGYALALGAIGWIVSEAATTLKDVQQRQIVNEREDALRELRIKMLEEKRP